VETPIFQADKCPLTGIARPNLKYFEHKIPDEKFGKRGFQWFYPYSEKVLLVVEGELFEDQSFWDNNRVAIFYLIENGIWPSGKMVDKPLLEALISSSDVPKSPFEKMKEILSFISINQKHFGEWYSLDHKDYDSLVRKLGLVYPDELEGIIKESSNYGLLEIKAEYKEGMVVILSLKGWELADERNQDKQSDTVFVAMAFTDDMKEIFNNSIRPAIEACGFKAKIVSEDYLKGDQTINDAILAGIKKAKFTVADFTHHRNGVYFEAGYALGRGQSVIYSCREDQIGTAHFDTRNYQHLVWKDGADLKKKLMDKIEVFIKA
jgi:hypothetical protein